MRGDLENHELTILRQWLSICAEKYLSDDLDDQRLAVVTALMEVSRYLESIGLPAKAILPIIRPAQALADRQQNELDPMFAKRLQRQGGRPRATASAKWRTALLACFADKWLEVRSGDGRDQKLKLAEAARKMKGPWFEGVSAARLKSARELISCGAKDDDAVLFYKHFKEFFDEVTDRFGGERGFMLMVRYINKHEISQFLKNRKTPPVSTTDYG